MNWWRWYLPGCPVLSVDRRVCGNGDVIVSCLLYASLVKNVISDSIGGTNATGTFPVNALSSGTSTLYIALAFGFSLLVNAWIFFRISGSLFNPAVSLAM